MAAEQPGRPKGASNTPTPGGRRRKPMSHPPATAADPARGADRTKPGTRRPRGRAGADRGPRQKKASNQSRGPRTAPARATKRAWPGVTLFSFTPNGWAAGELFAFGSRKLSASVIRSDSARRRRAVRGNKSAGRPAAFVSARIFRSGNLICAGAESLVCANLLLANFGFRSRGAFVLRKFVLACFWFCSAFLLAFNFHQSLFRFRLRGFLI